MRKQRCLSARIVRHRVAEAQSMTTSFSNTMKACAKGAGLALILSLESPVRCGCTSLWSQLSPLLPSKDYWTCSMKGC